MTAFLLDVNILIALMWPAHEGHTQVQQWFSRSSRQGWATCPFTQAGFVRIICNPAFSRDAVEPQEALKMLSANLEHPSHRFWPDEISLGQAALPFAQNLAGHQQVTDSYLLGLALHKKGKLATMDRSILALFPDKKRTRELVELV